MKFVVLVGALCLAASLVFAAGASADLHGQAYGKARACFVSHGAKKVRARTLAQGNVGGGWGELQSHWFSWWYEPDMVHVSVAIGRRDAWPAWAKTMISGCAQKSVPGGRLLQVEEE